MATILSISSAVTTGHVGNSAAVFALQRLGHEVWPVTTVALPHHPGHGVPPEVARHATPPEVLDATLRCLADRGWLAEVDAVLVGYMAAAEQSAMVAGWLARLRAGERAPLVMVDPIIGDAGTLYVGSAVAEAARDLLIPLADIVKPNLFELGWLTGHEVRGEAEALVAMALMGRPEVVVTSAPAGPGRTGNLALAGTLAFATETGRIEPVPKGTGDLFGALYLAARLEGEAARGALERATDGTFAVLAEGRARGSRELAMVAAQDRLAARARGFAARELAPPRAAERIGHDD